MTLLTYCHFFFTTPWVSLMTTKWIVNCCCLLYFLCLFPHLDYILLFHPCTVQYIRLASFKAMHITANAQTHSLPHEPSRQGTMSHCTVSTNCQKQSKEWAQRHEGHPNVSPGRTWLYVGATHNCQEHRFWRTWYCSLKYFVQSYPPLLTPDLLVDY